jgi:hypothetical protein
MAEGPVTVTLEQAWHYLMTLIGYKAPTQLAQASQQRRALRNLMAGRALWR